MEKRKTKLMLDGKRVYGPEDGIPVDARAAERLMILMFGSSLNEFGDEDDEDDDLEFDPEIDGPVLDAEMARARKLDNERLNKDQLLRLIARILPRIWKFIEISAPPFILLNEVNQLQRLVLEYQFYRPRPDEQQPSV